MHKKASYAGKNNCLLTGVPGVGKTTVIIRLAEKLKDRVAGFYTAEIRQGKRRSGFEIVSLSTGRRAVLAHVDFAGRRVGRYGVRQENLQPFLAELEKALGEKFPLCLLIDEIGKMELLSRRFKETVSAAFDSHHALVATIMARTEPFCDNLKKRVDTDLFEINRNNRDGLPAWLLSYLGFK